MSHCSLNTKALGEIFGKKILKCTFLHCEARNASYEIRFFDTSPLIYYLDGIEPFASKVENYMLFAMDNKCALYTSSITDMEYLVYPYRKKNITKISTYKSFLRNAQFLKVSIDEKIAETAAQIRARYSGIKSMDALQLASAMISGCDVFLTNDKQLRQVNEIQVLLVDDL